MATTNELYERFNKLLEQTDETVYEVCKATGIHQSTMTRWAQNVYTPKLDKLIKIADHFGVSIEYFTK